MKTIHKYNLPIKYGYFEMELPKWEGRTLCIKVQNNIPVFYIETDTDEQEMATYSYFAAYTGHQVPENVDKYLGTVILNNDTFVVHYYGV
jgi:hypothetical protein